ncbi:cytochrome P450 [Actinomadura algeriensis]|uniref:Cytochrome P450 n=1 Tax=Actinomadura algeriensis TaxID=1679523 RepID=A0ABR9JIZ9_9ACTN|nr:cytochrome P450 [Actinomadura algeriensis]MBE1530524.1 cytochrome P450 [Actinomadura algeriensis]
MLSSKDENARDFPFRTPNQFHPPCEHAQLRDGEPVARVRLPTGHGAWVATRYADVRRVCTDPRFSKAAVTAPGAPRLIPMQRGSKSLVIMDPPEHTRLRKIVSREFTARRVERLRPHVRELTEGYVDRMLRVGAPADLISALALPLPVTVICEMLGVPPSDRERFQGWTDGMLTIGAPALARADEIKTAAGNLRAYLAELIAAKLAEPSGDLLSTLGRAHADEGRLAEDELLTFGMTLLAAGYHTTTAAITHSVFHLLREPERYASLREDPAAIPAAVEELLRFGQIGGGAGAIRIAVEDVELGGVTVREGEAVIPLFNAANRDPEVFADPDTLDLRREDNPHIGLGHGIHFCLGAPLARLELQVVLEVLVRRLPGLRLAIKEDDITWQEGLAFARPSVLPLDW